MTLSYRRFVVVGKVLENSSVVSLYLEPVDKGPLKEFKPGQHMMFRFQIPGRDIPEFRFYSFSDRYREDHYRVSVKRELPPARSADLPPGLCSSYICDEICEGMILEAKGPSGDFCLVPEDNSPVVLLAGGIGITPLLSMIKSIAHVNPRRSVHFFYGVNEKREHSFKLELNALKKDHPSFSITTFYAKVGDGDVQGSDYDYEGFIDIEKICKLSADVDIDYYVCGPAAMMNYFSACLEESGVRKEKIHTESFNDPYKHLSEDQDLGFEIERENAAITEREFIVEFTRSNRKLAWDSRYRSILEFAEANDIEIASGCLFGDCGSCLTKLREGGVRYIHDTTVIPGKGECLPCSSVPLGRVVLEA